MFPAKDYVSLASKVYSLDKQADLISKNKFWTEDVQNNVTKKDWCTKLLKSHVFKYISDFLPAFGFHRYRQSDRLDTNALIIQKKGRLVRIIGSERDADINNRIRNWTVDCVKHLQSPESGVTVPRNLLEQIYQCNSFFDLHFTSYLPELPKVEVDFVDENGDKRSDKFEQIPFTDSEDYGRLCFRNKHIIIKKDCKPISREYKHLPKNLFVWENDIIDRDIEEIDASEPKGMWWDFLNNLSRECIEGEWKVNENNLRTIVTAYGYLLHDYNQPDNRKAIIFYDNTIMEKEGGTGKGILTKSLSRSGIRKEHFVDMKQNVEKDRFLLDGYTPDKRILRLDDVQKGLKIDSFYCWIFEDFTVEWKNRNKFVVPEEQAPKMIITTNHPIPNSSRSDKRRQFFVPVGTFYGDTWDKDGRTVGGVHGTLLAHPKSKWTTKDWTEFYATCAYCLQEYLIHGLIEVENEVLEDQQELRACKGDDILKKDLNIFVAEVLSKSPSECSRTELDAVFDSPEFERYSDYQPSWRTRLFKEFCGAKNISVNAAMKGGRYQKRVNNAGDREDYYLLHKNEKKTDEPQKVGLQPFLVEAT